jgi:hypothetical protein
LKTQGMLSKMTGKTRTDGLDVDDLTMKTKKKVMFVEEDDQIVDKDKYDEDTEEE